MLKIIAGFEKTLYGILLFLLGIVLIASVLDLAYIVFEYIFDERTFPLLENKEILSIFSLFLLVLIGIEFFETILAYLRENVIHVEVIIMVAVIAVARKIIVLDTSDTTTAHLIGLSLLMVSLGAAYYLVRHSNGLYPLKKE
ncbi:MAG: phosphate-starvation-inducible PsiE family protein [Methanospirillum sp.]|uniref:phosphate-starvation-inducible PsiE family protein n=1 Tax=Methanospirillum sp. TaxID=45200 RepID=UPI0023702165|nr:phosphate-starvation-inducible PsiE family protein [Methanospirillum sp.]MDD1729965.1 phosphate-starvation-inducible PsiE family protein [Methanospirillum sp.]